MLSGTEIVLVRTTYWSLLSTRFGSAMVTVSLSAADEIARYLPIYLAGPAEALFRGEMPTMVAGPPVAPGSWRRPCMCSSSEPAWLAHLLSALGLE